MSRSWLTIGLGLLAGVLLVVAVALTVSPAIVPSDIIAIIDTIDETTSQRAVVIVVAGTISMFALWRVFWSGAADVDEELVPTTTGVESATGSANSAGTPNGSSESVDVSIVGEGFTNTVGFTLDGLERGRDPDSADVVRKLRETLQDIETAHGYDSEAVSEHIRSGDWTDDRIAAAFLASNGNVSVPRWRRIYAWLFPARSFERRLERTLDAIEAREAALAEGTASTVSPARKTTASTGGDADA